MENGISKLTNLLYIYLKDINPSLKECQTCKGVGGFHTIELGREKFTECADCKGPTPGFFITKKITNEGEDKENKGDNGNNGNRNGKKY